MKNQEKIEKLTKAVYSEWKSMWHNATLLGGPHFDNCETQYQQDIFDEFVNAEVNVFLPDLTEDCKENFGIETDFYQYGRMGATIAPDLFQTNNQGEHSNSPKIKEREDFETGKEYIAYLENLLNMFRYINKRVSDGIGDLPEKWKEFVEANNLLPKMKENQNKHHCSACGHLINNLKE